MKQIRKRGITIVTLVITVIVLAVLTGAVMLTMVGDNGIFGETQTTIDKYNKQAMLEQIQLKIQKKRLAKVNEGQYSLNLSEDILPILETFGTYNENEMKLTTTEKNIDIYLYEIVNIPINEIADVTYANEQLTITEKVQLPNGYTFEYTKDNGITWSEYTTTTTITEENGILIRLKNEEGKIVSSEYKVTSGVIEEIDSTKPIISIDTNGVTTGKTIKVTIIVTDEKGLDRNNTYEYCISTSNTDTTGATWIPYTNGISFTVGEGLTGGYYIHVKGVTDTSGNESGNKVSEMLTFDNTVPTVTIDIGRITDTSIEVLAQSTDNSGQVKSTEYSIDNGANWTTANTFTKLIANTSYTVQVKSVDIFNNENTVEKAVTTNPRTWNGKIDISWYTKDPTKTTFDISTPNELAGLAILVDNETVYYDDPHDANATSGTYSIAGSEFEGKTIVLNNDILINENVLNEDGTLNETNVSSFVQWDPIGEATYINSVEDYITTFKGTIDGNNNVISGIYVNDGTLFAAGFVSTLENGAIQNLTIANSYIYGERYIGGLVGTNNGGDIYNCASEDNLIVGNSFRIGGIVGCNKSGTVNNSHNTSKVVSNTTGEVGGIIGHMINGIVDTCYNTGEITAQSNGGGIVGRCASYSAWNDSYCKIINCYNLGNIIPISAGGILGSAGDGPYNIQVDILNSWNEAIMGGSEIENCGGICGFANTGYDHDVTVNILNSYNSMDAQILQKAGGGGIFGKTINDSNSIIVVNISNVYNAGTISDNAYSGGIDGFAYTNKNLKYCYNLFPLSTGGGISGRSASIYTIDSCYNIDSKRFAQEVTETNPGTIDSSQNLTLGVTINGSTHTTLLSALNAWVNANKSTYPELKNWVMGSDGYPTLDI